MRLFWISMDTCALLIGFYFLVQRLRDNLQRRRQAKALARLTDMDINQIVSGVQRGEIKL